MKGTLGIMGILIMKGNDELVKAIIREELEDNDLTNAELAEIILASFKCGKKVGHAELKATIAVL